MTQNQSLLDRCQADWDQFGAATEDAATVDELWRRIDDWLELRSQATRGFKNSPEDSPTADRSVSSGSSGGTSLSSGGRRCRRLWASVRLFVSSTGPGELAEEHECLAKRVFPALRDWCEARRIALYECDLRRGANENFSIASAATLALEALAQFELFRAEATAGRCGESVFFLGLLGLRGVGWVPPSRDSQLTPEQVERLNAWPPGCSDAQMEFLSGALSDSGRSSSSNNALFMLSQRRPASDIQSLASAHAARHRLEVVRRFPAEQVVEYSDLDAFADRVLAFFRKAIAEQLPGQTEAPQLALDAFGAEIDGDSNEAHINYMQSLLPPAAVGHDRCLRLLTHFVETGDLSMADFKLFGDSADHIAFGLPGVKSVVIAGDAGAGKSTVLARLGARFQDRKGFEVLAHFAQFSPASNDRRTLQRKMKAFLKSVLPVAETAKASDDCSVSDLFNSVMEVRRTLLILIDAFECFYEVSHVGELLPVAWPQNVRCIVSCRKKDLDRCFNERSVCLYELEGLGDEAQVTICRTILPPDTWKAIADSTGLLDRPCASNPLWLSHACHELHLQHLSEASGLPSDARSLIRRIVSGVIAEDGGNDGPTAALLALVAVARVGLWERHARRVLQFAAARRASNGVASAEKGNSQSISEELPQRDYLRLLLSTRPFVRTIARESTALAFRHELVRTAVHDLLLNSPELAKRWHSLAAEFILTLRQEESSVESCLTRDLPYHLYWSDRRTELHAILQGAAPESRRQFGERIPHLTASGVYSSWRCRISKVSDKSTPASLVSCPDCAARPGRVGGQSTPRSRCCIYCGLELNAGRPGAAIAATTCRQHLPAEATHPRCWFCRQLFPAEQAAALQVCNLCNAAASSYLCYQPVMETDSQFSQVVRNQTKKFGLQW